MQSLVFIKLWDLTESKETTLALAGPDSLRGSATRSRGATSENSMCFVFWSIPIYSNLTNKDFKCHAKFARPKGSTLVPAHHRYYLQPAQRNRKAGKVMPIASMSKQTGLQISDRSFLASLWTATAPSRNKALEQTSVYPIIQKKKWPKSNDSDRIWQVGQEMSWNVVKAQRKRRLLIAQQSNSHQHSSTPFALAVSIRASPQDTRNLGTTRQKPRNWQPEFSKFFWTRRTGKHCWNEWLKCMETSSTCVVFHVQSPLQQLTKIEFGCMKCTDPLDGIGLKYFKF